MRLMEALILLMLGVNFGKLRIGNFGIFPNYCILFISILLIRTSDF